MCRRRLSVWLSGQVSYSEGFRRMFRQSFKGGIRQGFGTAPKGLSVGCFGNTCHSPKGSERLFQGGTSRRGFRRGLPGGCLRKGFPRGSSKGCEGVFRKASAAGGYGRG